jgi:hypothetical protein
MNPDNDFEDWSHSSRGISVPPRRRRVHGVVWCAIALALIALCWYAGHAVVEAYRVVFGS